MAARLLRLAATLCLLATTITTAAGLAAAVPVPPESAGTPYPGMCLPGSTHPDCPPPVTPPPSRHPPPSGPEPVPPSGPVVPPSPTPSPTPPAPPVDTDSGTNPGDRPEPFGIAALVSGAIESFFRSLAVPGLNSLMDLLADSILVTPKLDEVPVMGQLWGTSQHVMLAAYGTIVLAGGLVVMCHETLQTRQSLKEILPRLIVGFLTAMMSLFFGGKAIDIANAVSRSILGEHLDPKQAAATMTDALMRDLDDGILVVFLILAIVVMLIVVMLTYVVRMTLTVILLAAAPLMLMCHALPATEQIAFTWWKAMGGVLVIQIGQSLALVGVIKLFFFADGISLFGSV